MDIPRESWKALNNDNNVETVDIPGESWKALDNDNKVKTVDIPGESWKAEQHYRLADETKWNSRRERERELYM